jgi:acyl-coenzyme A synthetase/AMP-(fatty) acid ligase
MVLLDNFAQTAELRAEDVVAGIAPAGTGATGYVFPILTPLLHGATSVILERWSDPEDAVDLIAYHRCTTAVGIPTQLTRMRPSLERRTPEQFEDFRLFVNAGAPLPYDTGFKIEALMACKIQSMYGSTDGGTPVMTTVKDPKEKRLRTVGKVVPGCECELWDLDGQVVPQGQSGEVAWRSADKSWGYLGDDDQTAKTFTAQRFYRSGDLGQFDSEGYLRIIGRVKDMILRGGRNVFPLTIEEQLVKHPSILEVAVTAMPDPILGERACAFVVLRRDQELTFESAVDFLKGQKLAVWQLPERLEIMEDLPRGPGGKVIKSKLTDLVTEKLRHEGKL